MSDHDFRIARELSALEKRKAEEWDHLYEENERLRAEVKRRGEMLRECHALLQQIPLVTALDLTKRIEALTDED